MKVIYRIWIVFLLLSLYYQQGLAKNLPLFASEEPLELILEADLVAITEDKSDEPEYTKATLIRVLEDYKIRAFEIKVKPRGNTRRVTDLCEFPPLKFNFKKSQVTNTVFDGQDKLKFVSQCRKEKEFKNYVLEEYLLYKTYNLLTEESYKTRLVKLTLKDIKLRIPSISMTGFLIEDNETLEKRIGAKRFEKLVYSQDSCTAPSVDRLSLFQFMIGNTDWYINTKHNTDIFQMKKNGALIPVPFDFDFAGVINTYYAIPSKQIPITNVRQRYYKGSCRSYDEYEETIELFNQKKKDIFALYNSFELLPKSVIKKSLRYYTKFYSIINDPQRVNEVFVNVCNTNYQFRVRN